MARTAKTSVAALQAENKRLATENATLKKQLSSSSHRLWQKIVILICVALAGALLVTGNILFWAGNSLVKEDRFVATTSPLIKQPEIQQGIALYATNKLYENVDIEQEIQNVLPPRAEFLAPSISGQVRNATQSSLEKILANEKFQDTWTSTVTKAHSRIINYVKNYQGNGTISLNDVYQSLSKQLEGTKLSFAANKTLPSSVGSITLIQASWLPAAHNLVTNIDLYRFLAILIVMVASALAIWLARNRRKMVIGLGALYSVLMAISLLSIRIFQQSIPAKVASEYQPAVKTAVNIITQPLIIQTRTILLLSILTMIVAWLTGPYKVAVTVRERIQTLLEGKVHQAVFAKENAFTRWVGRYKRVLQWAAVLVIAIVMLFFVQLSPKLVVLYGLLMLAIALVVELLAAPVSSK